MSARVLQTPQFQTTNAAPNVHGSSSVLVAALHGALCQHHCDAMSDLPRRDSLRAADKDCRHGLKKIEVKNITSRPGRLPCLTLYMAGLTLSQAGRQPGRRGVHGFKGFPSARGSSCTAAAAAAAVGSSSSCGQQQQLWAAAAAVGSSSSCRQCTGWYCLLA
jgi:hypothetical protein